jgi:alpha-tubulin suppressor-like RCC1 family protein
MDVAGLSSGVVAVAAGWASTCALTSAGGVKCWGYNSNGQLGNNSTTDSSTPVDVAGLTSGVVAITAGNDRACALTREGAVKCWGVDYANLDGLQGSPSTSQSTVPVEVNGLSSGVAAVSAGGDHTCVLTSAGGVKCWGFNANGQLGNNSTTDSQIPVDVVGLSSGVLAVSAGNGHTCALTSEGGVKCWGLDNVGELGDHPTSYLNSSVPVDAVGLSSGVVTVSAALYDTCTVTLAGAVPCWGQGADDLLGNGSDSWTLIAADVPGLSSGFVSVSAGSRHACAVAPTGGLTCWGADEQGQLGDGATLASSGPVAVVGF